MTTIFANEFLAKTGELFNQLPDVYWTDEVMKEVMEFVSQKQGEDIHLKTEEDADKCYLHDQVEQLLEDKKDLTGDIESRVTQLLEKIEETEDDALAGLNDLKAQVHTLTFQLEKAKVFLAKDELAKVVG